jgi:hypothetical protein
MTAELPRVEKMAQHPHKPTENFQLLQAAMADVVQQTVDERARRDRERIDATDYTRNQRADETGG